MSERIHRYDQLFGAVDLSKIIAEDEAAIESFRRGEVDEIVLPHSRLRLTWTAPEPTRWQYLKLLWRTFWSNE